MMQRQTKMNPIEKVHKMIVSGLVLGPKGRWIHHTEALKIKCEMLKHIADGEVEINGKWVKLNEIGSEPHSIPFSLPALENIHDDNKPTYQNLPPRPIVNTTEKEIEPKEGVLKDTVMIRTVPLGKETSLTISESRIGGSVVAVCSVRGFIDHTNLDLLHNQLLSMLEYGVRFFIIDMEFTTLVTSAAWGMLASVAKLVKTSRGLLIICSMKKETEESFHLLQFDEIIEVRKTMEDSFEVFKTLVDASFRSSSGYTGGAQIFQYLGESFEELPIHEKIKTIISRNGPVSFFKIAWHLRQEQYGKVKINPIKLYFLLKELNLETHWKRVRYYRSC